MLHFIPSSSARRGVTGVAVLVAFLAVSACNTATPPDPLFTSSIPLDYRERHPIRLVENMYEAQLLIGAGTGVLTADQRAQVSYMASTWRQEGTGHLIIQTPQGTPNQRSAAYAAREATSILRASGVPQRAIQQKSYPLEPGALGAVRISYARIEAEAGPCGRWPEDIGAAVFPSLYPMPPQWDNRQYWNYGCATQQGLAATIANPEDLVQPRASTPPYAARRQTVIEKYRKGENPSGAYETGEAQASSVGQ